ncbi:unnamed protein product [Rotaria sp. Silwood2]|nr:unnamed protein product [Rotaria sp. Silwood2]
MDVIKKNKKEDYANTLCTLSYNNERKILYVPHNKQELIAKILRLENRTKFINITADELDDGTSSNVSGIGQNRRQAGMWVTDAIHMPDTHKLVFASTSPDLRFLTISSETFLEEFMLFRIKNVPTCLEYFIQILRTLGGKTPNFGLFPIDLYLNKSTNNADKSLPRGLSLACNDYLCIMKLGQDTSRNDGSLTETHTASLITCADNSSMGAWNIESGRKAYFIFDAHDGARNGDVKIWNSANGQNFHVLASVEDAEITGIVFADKGIITVGWLRKIVIYSDIVSELVVPKADLSSHGSQIHRDDISCLEHLLTISNLMYTPSYDDEINVWSIDTEKLVISRREPSNYSRSSSHRSIIQGPAPLDKLLFLRYSAKENIKYGDGSFILTRSTDHTARLWTINGEEIGIFGQRQERNTELLLSSKGTK